MSFIVFGDRLKMWFCISPHNFFCFCPETDLVNLKFRHDMFLYYFIQKTKWAIMGQDFVILLKYSS